jgi:hypothetical protein
LDLVDSGAISSFILVGRVDGTVDLFQMDAELPLQSWNLSESLNDLKSKKNSSVVMVRWVPSKPSMFFAADSFGYLYLFDLLQNPHKPISVEKLSISNKLNLQSIDISDRPMVGVNNINILSNLNLVIAGGEKKNGQILIRKLNKFSVNTDIDEEEIFRDSFNLWSARDSIQQFVAVLSDLEENRSGEENSLHK